MNASPKAVSRLPALPEPPTDPVAGEMYRTIQSRGRRILNIHRMEMHSPRFFRAQATFAAALRDETVLPRSLVEIVIVRTAMLQKCPYVLGVHAGMARDSGVSGEQLAALESWEASDLFDERERAALAFTDLMATDGKSVGDAAFARLAEKFNAQEILEIATLCGFYLGNCRRVNALGLRPEDEYAGG